MISEVPVKKSIVVISSLTNFSTAGYLISALKKAGHFVFVISDTYHSASNLRCTGAFDLPSILKQSGISPDLILFIEGGSMRLLPMGLSKIPCITAWYGIDTHMNYEKHFRLSCLFDATFIAQYEYVDQLRIDGIRQVFWLPLAFENSLHPVDPVEKTYDVAYVGSDNAIVHPVRHRILKSLVKQFPNSWYGMADPKRMALIYAKSRVVFNKSINNDVNMRIFEACGAGTVLVTDEIRNNGLDSLYEKNIHYESYENESDVIKLVYRLLNDETLLTKISEGARTHTLENHTYAHRAAKLIKLIESSKKLPAPSEVNSLSALLIMGMAYASILQFARLLRLMPSRYSLKILINFIAIFVTLTGLFIGIFEFFLDALYRFRQSDK